MDRTKTQRETVDFSMTLVIKTHQNNNNKKHINFFWGGTGIYQFILGGTSIIFYFFYSFNFFIFEKIGGTIAPAGPLLPSSL
jgi:hypothetical protein